MNNHEDLVQELKSLIGINRTEKALELLARAQLSDLDKDLIILNSRYSKVTEDQRLGVIDGDLAQRRINTINRDLLDLSERIGKVPIRRVSSSPLLEKENTFNKWWAIAPVLLLIMAGGIYMMMNSKSDSIGIHSENPGLTISQPIPDPVPETTPTVISELETQPPGTPTIDPGIEKAYNKLLARGNYYFEKKDFKNALRKYKEAKIKVPNGIEAQQGIDECTNQLKSNLPPTTTVRSNPQPTTTTARSNSQPTTTTASSNPQPPTTVRSNPQTTIIASPPANALKYGDVYIISNGYNSWKMNLKTCGKPSGSSASSLVYGVHTGSTNKNKSESKWMILSASSKGIGEIINDGDKIYLQNQYNNQNAGYLDIVGEMSSPCSNGYTHYVNTSKGKATKWTIASYDSGPITLGEMVQFRNEVGTSGWLGTCGTSSCENGNEVGISKEREEGNYKTTHWRISK